MSIAPGKPAAERLATELYKLYTKSNVRTFESLAKRLGCSRTTATAILNGDRTPDKDMIARLVEACVDDIDERPLHLARLRDLWEDAAAEKRLAKRRSSLSLLTEQKDPVGRGFEKDQLPVTWYVNNSEFYSAAAEYVRSAQGVIRVTYLRQTPPTQVTSAEAAAYFDAILDWAREPGAREVNRIIGAPLVDGKLHDLMLTWMASHREATEPILNYEARVMPWMSRGDGLNMALFDGDTSFLAVSGQGGRQHLSGFSVTSERYTDYLMRYFDQLWHTLESLAAFLNRIQ